MISPFHAAARLVPLVLLVWPLSSPAGYNAANIKTSSDGTVETIPLSATVSSDPPRVTIRVHAPGTYAIYRKDPADVNWGSAVASGVVLAQDGFWVDEAVTTGAMYEYKFVNTAGTPYLSLYPTGYLLSGIAVDQTGPRGRLALLVASEVPEMLPVEYAGYVADLVRDGWTVHVVPCPRPADYKASGISGLTTVAVVHGGSGYTNGATVMAGNGVGTAALKLTVSGGVITAASVAAPGARFAVDDLLTITGAGGTGASLKVTGISDANAGSRVVVTAGGAGYRDNDRVTLTGETSGRTAWGSVIAPAGTVTGVSAVLPTEFLPGETVRIEADAGGGGATGVVSSKKTLHLVVREAVQALDSAYPQELKMISLLGRVPVCRSGLNDGAGSDGHGNRAAYAADAFYADLDGTIGNSAGQWRDLGNNLSTGDDEQWNMPNDDKFDARKISEVGNGRVELGFGRIDLSNTIEMEYEALRSYLSKLHRYKTASPDFQVPLRACDRRLYPNISETGIQAMPAIVGFDQVDVITSAGPGLPGYDADSVYSAQNGPYLFYFKGNGGPGYSEGGRAVFWTGMQSHYGYWYDASYTTGTNLMQLRLAEDNFTLSWTWSIWGLRYIYHRMGMGLDAGDMMKQSINNQGRSASGTYAYRFQNTNNGDFSGSLYMNHMGDPALRLYVFAPPTGLSATPGGGGAVLSWTPSPDPTVTGYHVYRKPAGNGPYTRLTEAPVTGSSYTDASGPAGSVTYMVRAVRLQTTGAGTFWNASLGAERSIDLAGPAAPLVVDSSALEDAHWGTPYPARLTATGGYPVYTWSVAAGSLPPGLSLASDGTFAGTPEQAGDFSFTVQVTDQTGASAERVVTLSVRSNDRTVLYPVATAFTDKSRPADANGGDETNKITGATSYQYETFQRFDLSGLDPHNGLRRATLRLYVSSTTPSANYSLVQAQLVADALDGWVETGRSVAFSTTFSDNGAGQIRLNAPDHGFQTGDQVTISGFSATPPNGVFAITRVDKDRIDLPVAYSAAYSADPALAFATSASITYSNRPTVFQTSAGTASATAFAQPLSFLEIDVTSFVAETLANDPLRLLGLRLFSTGPQTISVGSRKSSAGARPQLVIETSDAPRLAIHSPAASPVYVHAGNGLQIDAAVTPLPARAAALTRSWSQVAGPGAAAFSQPAADSPSVTFPVPGKYTLRLQAADGQLSATSDLDVVVMPPTAGLTVAAGSQEGLVARLPFDELSGTAAGDVSGVSPANNGALANLGGSGLPHWQPAGGRVGGALAFDGTNQRVEIPDSAANPLDGMQKLTVAFWVKIAAIDAFSHGLVVKRTSSSSSTISYAITLNASQQIVAAISNKAGATSTAKLLAGEWCHVAMVFDGSLTANNLLLFINGAPDKAATVTGLPGNAVPRISASPLRVGDYTATSLSGSSAYGLNGQMDEVRIYNRALAPREVLELASGAALTGPRIRMIPAGEETSAGQPLTVSADVEDDGAPSPVQVTWSHASGPGGVAFSAPFSAATAATFSAAGAQIVRLSATDGAVTTFADRVITVTAAGGLAAWRQQFFGSSDNSGDAADTANPSGDGLPNLVKYALGLDPTLSHASAPEAPRSEVRDLEGEEYLTLTFTRDTRVSDVEIRVEVADSPAGPWTSLDPLAPANQAGFLHDVPAAGLQTITVRDVQPLGDFQRRFIRLRVKTVD